LQCSSRFRCAFLRLPTLPCSACLVVDEVLSIENIIAYEGSTEVKQMCNNGFITGVAKGHKSEEVLLVIDEEKIMSNA
jgi:hypothetical protein